MPNTTKKLGPAPGHDSVGGEAKARHQIVNFADLVDVEWTFLATPLADLPLDWHFFSAVPRSPLERFVKRPRLARWRGVWSAVRCAARDPNTVIISHLPKTTLWLVVFCYLLSVKPRHVAFSFNFTKLPRGIERSLMRWAFSKVDRFVVFSNVERAQYSEYFGIDLARIDYLPWEMAVPQSSEPAFLDGKYVCAVGGEGRDYETLIRAARYTPHIRIVIVTRGYNAPHGQLPANVELHTELGGAAFWSIVKHAHAVIVPLHDAQTNCGHITLVGALLFGRPIVASRSTGIQDYVTDNVNALIFEPGDPRALQQAIETIWSDALTYERLHSNISTEQIRGSATSPWSTYFRQYFAQLKDS